MPNDTPVSIIVFDVNETLLDITTLEPLFDRIFNDPAVLRVVRAVDPLPQTMTLSGLYALWRLGRGNPENARIDTRHSPRGGRH